MTTAATGAAASDEPAAAPHTEGFTVRRATAEDLPEIVAMLADDPLGATRESPDDPAPYREAFARIDADPNQHLVVAERDGRTVGTLQLTVIPGLSRRGASRALIEAGRQGCALVQLTSDATRVEAHRFYERLGFEASHLGFKKPLT